MGCIPPNRDLNGEHHDKTSLFLGHPGLRPHQTEEYSNLLNLGSNQIVSGLNGVYIQ